MMENGRPNAATIVNNQTDVCMFPGAENAVRMAFIYHMARETFEWYRKPRHRLGDSAGCNSLTERGLVLCHTVWQCDCWNASFGGGPTTWPAYTRRC